MHHCFLFLTQNITGALKKDSNILCPPLQKPFTAAVPVPAPFPAELADLRRTIDGLSSAVAGLVAWKQQTEASLASAAGAGAAAQTTADAAAAVADNSSEGVEDLRQHQFQLERAVQGILAWRVEVAAEATARPSATQQEVATLAGGVAGCCAQVAALRDAQARLAADVEGRVGAAARELSALALARRRASATRAVRVSPVAVGLGTAADMATSERVFEELVEALEQRPGPCGSGAVKKGAGKKGAPTAGSK